MTTFVRLPDGTVCDDPPTPTQAWTPEEWTDELAAHKDRLASAVANLESLPKPLEVPVGDYGEAVRHYNETMIIPQLYNAQAEVDRLKILIGELEKV